jgi:hypothetical protein
MVANLRHHAADRVGVVSDVKVVAQYGHGIAKNKGIRIPNLLQILLPIGVLEAEIASAWLSTTDGFGAKRGTTVHSASIMYTIDPQDDFQTVNQIMASAISIFAKPNQTEIALSHRNIRAGPCCVEPQLLAAVDTL